MEITIGKRRAYFCNVKALLIFLVVYGHLIETRIEECDMLMWQYRIIYAVHMPLFAFLSGVFLKGKRECLAQGKKALCYYLIFQIICMFGMKMIQGTAVSVLEPFWHLWYLLSLSTWAFICLGLELVEKHLQGFWKKAILIIASVIIACVIGNVEGVDRTLSLSRTIAFLPYVLMGKYLPMDESVKNYKVWGILAGISSVIWILYQAPNIPIAFWYQADSYAACGVENGMLLRLISYVAGIGLGLCILVLIPQKKTYISKIGINTLWIYILHAPLVLVLREMVLWKEAYKYMVFFMAASIVIFIYKGFQWHAKLYRIE